MNFYPVYLRGRPHEIAYYRYGPIGQTKDPQHNSADAHVQRITLGSGERAIAGNIARMISAFEVNPDHRRRLGHDCAVFVLACQTGDDYSATAFGKSRNSPRIAPAFFRVYTTKRCRRATRRNYHSHLCCRSKNSSFFYSCQRCF